MPTCYICGSSGADYRRVVKTGYSVGSSWGSRSYRRNTRNYYGPRCVCKSCAASIDLKNRIRNIFLLVVVVCIALYIIIPKNKSHSDKSGSSMHGTVNVNVGLLLRDSPSSDKYSTVIPFNTSVDIIDTTGPAENKMGKTANWYEVKYLGNTGWVWSGYLNK